MKQPRPEFIIYAPSFDETSGGAIVLHALCDRLNKAGVPAALWPQFKPVPARWATPAGLRAQVAYTVRGGDRAYATGPFASPIARPADVRTAVVVYPEIVSGNPLGADKVVRWLLHKPGYHSGTVAFGPGDLYFHYTEAFASTEFDSQLLRVTHVNTNYRQTNHGPRTGSCLLVRKGARRVLDAHPADAVQVDGMSHQEMAAVFNRSEFLYTYDSYTLYTLYAALCGCPSVFLPPDGLTVTEWAAGGRVPGLAFGEGEKEWARRTRPELVARLDRDLADEADLLASFVATCRARFRRS